MKRLALISLVMVSASLAQAQVFGPKGRVFPAVLPASAPQPQPRSVPVYTPTTTVVGAALGGVLGGKNSTQSATLGSAIGLVVGQVMDRRAIRKEEDRQRREVESAQNPVSAPGTVPASGFPAAAPAAPAGNIPLIDPNTGLPLAPGALPAPVASPTANPEAPSPLRPANKLFGR